MKNTTILKNRLKNINYENYTKSHQISIKLKIHQQPKTSQTRPKID